MAVASVIAVKQTLYFFTSRLLRNQIADPPRFLASEGLRQRFAVFRHDEYIEK